MATNAKHYVTANPFIRNRKSWLTADEADRVASYEVYDDMYWNNPETLAIKVRGENSLPIHVPAARVIANTMNRYIAPNFQVVPDPNLGTDSDRTAAAEAFSVLFKRERFFSKFIANKLSGVKLGDAVWYISGDPDKPEGSRLSLRTVHPGKYFELEDVDDPTRIYGAQLIEEITVGDDTAVRVQTWLKPGTDQPGYVNPSAEFISYQQDVWSADGYGTEDQEKQAGGEQIPVEPIEGITHLPLYRIANSEEIGEDTWGSSEFRGLETLFAGINQAISDEDMTLALQGLGLYYTDGGAPVDENGNETDWLLGPGEVVEVAQGRKFERVTGVSSVAASQDHVKYMEDRAARVSGASDVAQGVVDVSIAESGIALQLRLAPILESASQKEQWLVDRMDNLFYDLAEWFAAYEGVSYGEAVMVSKVGEKLPINKEQRFTDLLTLYQSSPPVISGATLRKELKALDFDIDDKELETILNEQIAFAKASEIYNSGIEGAGPQDQDALEEGAIDGEVVE